MDLEKVLNEIDPLCRDLVKFFNEQGLETIMSCEGHPPCLRTNFENTQYKFWIDFSKKVTDEDIKAFMSQFGGNYHRFRDEINSRFFGKFIKTYYGDEAPMRWRYVVDTYADCKRNQFLAKTDFKNFQKLLFELEV